MRLIDTTTLELHEFLGDVPYYAILSHRWEGKEVSFQDLNNDRGTQINVTGYAKIAGCCEQARLDGWKYVVSDDILVSVHHVAGSERILIGVVDRFLLHR